MFEEFKKEMTKEFEMTDIWLMSYYLGIEVKQEDKGILITQEGYANEVLKKFKMDDSNSVGKPMECGIKLSKHEEGNKVDTTLYKSLVGSFCCLTCEDSKQEVKNKNFSKGNIGSPKERHVSPRGSCMNDPAKRKMPPRFVISPLISLGIEWHLVKHKKFPQKLTKTQKRRIQRQRAMEKRQLSGGMLQRKSKEISQHHGL